MFGAYSLQHSIKCLDYMGLKKILITMTDLTLICKLLDQNGRYYLDKIV